MPKIVNGSVLRSQSGVRFVVSNIHIAVSPLDGFLLPRATLHELGKKGLEAHPHENEDMQRIAQRIVNDGWTVEPELYGAPATNGKVIEPTHFYEAVFKEEGVDKESGDYVYASDSASAFVREFDPLVEVEDFQPGDLNVRLHAPESIYERLRARVAALGGDLTDYGPSDERA